MRPPGKAFLPLPFPNHTSNKRLSPVNAAFRAIIVTMTWKEGRLPCRIGDIHKVIKCCQLNDGMPKESMNLTCSQGEPDKWLPTKKGIKLDMGSW